MSLVFTPHKHPEWEGKHSFFSPSSHRLDKKDWDDWNNEELINYIITTLRSQKAADIGTFIHEEAAFSIKHNLRIRNKTHASDVILRKLIRSGIPRSIINPSEFAETFMAYVNDGIGYGMWPEVQVGISDDAFGTVDALYFDYTKKLLRIHDLKTGRAAAKMEQLIEYAAYFCLEYKIKPGEIETELRIYQSGEIIVANPTAPDILPCMERIRKGNNAMIKINGGKKS